MLASAGTVALGPIKRLPEETGARPAKALDGFGIRIDLSKKFSNWMYDGRKLKLDESFDTLTIAQEIVDAVVGGRV